MIDVSVASTQYLNPKASNELEYDPETGRFADDFGIPLSRKEIASIIAGDRRVSGGGQGGITTLQRSALFKSLLQSEGARRDFLGQLRRQQDSSGEGTSGQLKGTFYSRNGVTSTGLPVAQVSRIVD